MKHCVGYCAPVLLTERQREFNFSLFCATPQWLNLSANLGASAVTEESTLRRKIYEPDFILAFPVDLPILILFFGLKAKPHDTLDLCVLLNDNLAQTVHSHPKRFVGLGTLPMQAPDLAVLEMRRCVKELGFPGVQIGSHINNWDLNASELYPFYAVRHLISQYLLM